MPYVHLANGETKQLTANEMNETFGDNPPRSLRVDNVEYAVIGVYPDGVEMEKEESTENTETTQNAAPETPQTAPPTTPQRQYGKKERD